MILLVKWFLIGPVAMRQMIEDYKKSSTFNQKTLDRYLKAYKRLVSIYYKLYVLTGNPKWKPPDFPLII